jgi:hypothetical protein
VAQVGVAPIALALLGLVDAVIRPQPPFLRWWGGLLVLSLAFVTASPWIFPAWNPRYGLFFMPPVWIMGASGSAAIAAALPKRIAIGWLLAVFLLIAPKLASHFVDGSRHDFRTAAAIVSRGQASVAVVSNWPATLQYYLEPTTGQRPAYWTLGQRLPDADVIVVYASNAWEPVLQVRGRTVTVLGEVGHRRFDEQSHLIRIYHVASIARRP